MAVAGQNTRRPSSSAAGKLLWIKANLFSYSLDKAFHSPEFQAKLFFTRNWVGGFYRDSLLNTAEVSLIIFSLKSKVEYVFKLWHYLDHTRQVLKTKEETLDLLVIEGVVGAVVVIGAAVVVVVLLSITAVRRKWENSTEHPLSIKYTYKENKENTIRPLLLGRTCKFIPPPWDKKGGGGGGWNPSQSFAMLQYFETISPSVESPWSSYEIRYILWMVMLLETCDVTNNSRHFGRHLGFYQELEIRLKPQEMVIFLCLTWKITHK